MRPPRITLRGVLEAPALFAARLEDDARWGSVLLAVEGQGNADGTPFLTMHDDIALVGMTIFYPEQKRPIPVPYPWTIRGSGTNISVIDCTLVNPYQALDFGTNAGGRHYLFNVNAQALYRGLLNSKCYNKVHTQRPVILLVLPRAFGKGKIGLCLSKPQIGSVHLHRNHAA